MTLTNVNSSLQTFIYDRYESKSGSILLIHIIRVYASMDRTLSKGESVLLRRRRIYFSNSMNLCEKKQTVDI